MKNFEIRRDERTGERYISVDLRGIDLRESPLYNKGSAFPAEERIALGLAGLLPPAVSTIEQQLLRVRENIAREKDDIDKYVYLTDLQNRNETLFYRLFLENLEEVAPIIYTPTVGKASQWYSHIFKSSRGLYITPGDSGHIRDTLRNAPFRNIDVIVVTDNERILGLGDLGAGGMCIPVGKLALYTVGAGIHPANTLPISLDVGTNNEKLLGDPMYLGLRQRRLPDEEYFKFIDLFVEEVRAEFPTAVLQWEDFKKEHAITLLSRYRDSLCTFNDDIQGTAAIAHAAVMGAMKALGQRIRDQRVVIMGSGAAGYGIYRQLAAAMVADGLKSGDVKGRILVLDSEGLLTDRRSYREKYKAELAASGEILSGWKIPDKGISLQTVVDHYRPTILMGVSGQTGIFSEQIVRSMASSVDRPIVMPMSNPTANAEAVPADIQRWSQGRALVATGSPFAPFEMDGRGFETSQANNVLVFPGVGMGAIVSRARRVTDGMFVAAANAVAAMLTADEIKKGQLLSRISALRAVSREVAIAVARQAVKEGVAEKVADDALLKRLEEKSWYPDYIAYRPA